jgi:hypothetical protein
MGLKTIYNKYISHHQITSDTFILLQSSVNMDLDDCHRRMNSWEFISTGLLQHWYLKLLSYLRNYPLIGAYATLRFYDHIFFAFEVTLSFVQVQTEIRLGELEGGSVGGGRLVGSGGLE